MCVCVHNYVTCPKYLYQPQDDNDSLYVGFMVTRVSVLLILGGCLAFDLVFGFTGSFPPFSSP